MVVGRVTPASAPPPATLQGTGINFMIRPWLTWDQLDVKVGIWRFPDCFSNVFEVFVGLGMNAP